MHFPLWESELDEKLHGCRGEISSTGANKIAIKRNRDWDRSAVLPPGVIEVSKS